MEPPQYMCVPVRMCGILWDTDQIDCEWKCREDGRSGHCVLVEPSATNAACACVCGKIGYNPCGVLCSTVWTSLVNTSCSITILDAAQWCHAVQELVSLARATSSPSQDVDSTTHSAHRLSSNHAPDSSGTQTEQHGLYHSTLTSVLDQTDTHTLTYWPGSGYHTSMKCLMCYYQVRQQLAVGPELNFCTSQDL